MEAERKYFDMKDLTKRYGLSRQAIYNRVAAGILPKGVKIGWSRRWSIKEIEDAEKHFQNA